VIRAAIALLAVLGIGSCAQPKTVIVTPTVGAPRAASSAVALLQGDLSSIFNESQFDHSFWSVLVRPAGSASNLYALNAEKLVLPGSAMKIVTAAAAAELLGWDYRFETRIATTAPPEPGVLRGDILIIGTGDPSISERSDRPGVLRMLARQVRESGILRVEGRIIGDDDFFDDKGWGEGWTLDNLPYGYSAPVSALIYNEGSVDLVISAGAAEGDPVAIEARPEGSGLEIDNRLVTVHETGTGTLTLHRLPGSSRLTVHGQIPAKSAPFVRTASVDNPTRFFAASFRQALLAEGVEVTGDAVDADELVSKPDVAAARTLTTWQSPVLSEIVTSMMKVSQNQYAEVLLRAIGGRGAMRQILNAWGVADDSYIVVDGSGLSRYNYVTSETLVRILQAMYAEPKHTAAFLNALPVAGRDGTLARRLVGTPAEGKVRAKTGTVDNVRAIAGYAETADGEILTFSIIANNFNVANSIIDAAADKALIRLATFARQSRNDGTVVPPSAHARRQGRPGTRRETAQILR
jgi:D-alanyl-D-alanine carboxypeptidase/D-alanyl-D-alanine-endopeptidase (penicillin-binding protein 4)